MTNKPYRPPDFFEYTSRLLVIIYIGNADAELKDETHQNVVLSPEALCRLPLNLPDDSSAALTSSCFEDNRRHPEQIGPDSVLGYWVGAPRHPTRVHIYAEGISDSVIAAQEAP